MGKYAIYIVSALIFSMLTYSNALRNAIFLSNNRTVESYSINQAHNIAQSAALVAVNDIMNDEDSPFIVEANESYAYPSSDQFQYWQGMNGSYNIRVTNQADTLLVLQSTGRFEESNYMVTIGMAATGGSLWMPNIDQAIHAENSITLGNGTVFGDISINNIESSFSSGPQGTITGDYYIYDENIDAGLVEDEDEGGGGNGNGNGNGNGKGNKKGNGNGGGDSGIQGSTYNMEEKIVFPDPKFPSFSSFGKTMVDNMSSSGTLQPSEYNGNMMVFRNFSTNNTTINVGNNDMVLHAKSIDLSKGLNIIGEGTLSIYVEDNLNLGNGDINAGGVSNKLGIYYKGSNNINYTGNGTFSGLLFAGNTETDIKIAGTPNFKGHIISFGDLVTLNGTPTASSLVYAPNATVSLKGTGRPGSDFRGAIISHDFTANGKASVIYDEDFTNTLPEIEQDEEVSFTMQYWN